MSDLKELLKDAMEIGENEDTALLFSGGVDSITCLFALLEKGITPTLYTFHLDGVYSKDLEVSARIASHYKLPHKIITIAQDVEALQKDVTFIVKELPVDRKTNVQCTYPFLHIMPHVKEKNVVSGLCADDLYGTSKSVAIKCSKNKAAFDDMRRKKFASEYSSAYLPIKTLVEKFYNKKFIAPYRNEKVIEYFMSFSWEELNRPKQKQIAVDAFSSYFNELDVYRRNCNLQVGSGVREFHNKLIDAPINKNNRKRVDEIYKDIKLFG